MIKFESAVFARRLFLRIAFCLGSHFLKHPFLERFFAFGLAFNFHVPDLGETYVSRNMSAWGVIF